MENSEIDKLVALNVMRFNDYAEHLWIGKAKPFYKTEWMPSREIECAWQVVERMQELGYIVIVTAQPKDTPLVTDVRMIPMGGKQQLPGSAFHSSAPMAICLAALQALGVGGVGQCQ